MAAIYSNGGNRWNILGFNFNKRDALSSVYKISMVVTMKYHMMKASLRHGLQKTCKTFAYNNSKVEAI
jgi:hypothetical protein